ncbi:GNAT family N-acetyltransferase [Vibrio hannami]|uniref:GNAT family N-acetyltransferase n=1 Tax=Vibrio hannami TaxID=2717094 RepID=UPI002410A4C6|nr:GNAT family N-acetyltransferase [Vibrio hannami]MDG3088290.1 GNAT family N-acetyltransferase [Vibrio hannami]
MTTRARNNIQCEWFDNPNRAWLEKAWQELEERSDSNFFLSWWWIGTWLECFVSEFTVIEARQSGVTVGLGIVVTQASPMFSSRSRAKHYLHRTGVPDEDQIWIEYNDFLIASENSANVRASMVSSTVNRMGSADALIIGASKVDEFGSLKYPGLSERTIWETTNYFLDLNRLRTSGTSLLNSLSKNARYQIKRSIRKYKEIGELSVKKVITQQGADELLALAEPLHLARWGNGKSGSGFANPKFIAFHKKLIAKGLGSGTVELNHIQAGDETIGIVYNYRYRNTIYFYLCAMNYKHHSSQYKPGLVTHYLLIEKALEEGVDIYDFMGGTARYKATFSNEQGNLAVYQFEHPRPLLSVEKQIRKLKDKWVNDKQRLSSR